MGHEVWWWSRVTVPYYCHGIVVGISADGHHALVEEFGRWWFRRLLSMDRLSIVVVEAAA